MVLCDDAKNAHRENKEPTTRVVILSRVRRKRARVQSDDDTRERQSEGTYFPFRVSIWRRRRDDEEYVTYVARVDEKMCSVLRKTFGCSKLETIEKTQSFGRIYGARVKFYGECSKVAV